MFGSCLLWFVCMRPHVLFMLVVFVVNNGVQHILIMIVTWVEWPIRGRIWLPLTNTYVYYQVVVGVCVVHPFNVLCFLIYLTCVFGVASVSELSIHSLLSLRFSLTCMYRSCSARTVIVITYCNENVETAISPYDTFDK